MAAGLTVARDKLEALRTHMARALSGQAAAAESKALVGEQPVLIARKSTSKIKLPGL